MTKEKYLKNRYLEAAASDKTVIMNRGTYFTPEMIYALDDMAREDVYPDERFSDSECSVWIRLHLRYFNK